MAKAEFVSKIGDQWGYDHFYNNQPVLIDWLKANIPDEICTPPVLGVIFHMSRVSFLVHESFKIKGAEVKDWNDFLERVVCNVIDKDLFDKYSTILFRMSLARSERGKEEWDFTNSKFISKYRSLANRDGLLVETAECHFKLNADIFKVFGAEIQKQGNNWLDFSPNSKEKDAFFDNLTSSEPLAA